MKPDVRFIPSNLKVLREALKIAEIRVGEDIFYELGSGDGRGPIMAVQPPYSARRAVGFEANSFLVELSKDYVNKLNLQNRVEIRNEDFFRCDLSGADVVFMYLGELLTERIRPKLEDELKPESRVVSHYYSVKGWKPSKSIDVIAPKSDTGPLTHRPVHFYRMKEIY